MVRVSAKRRAKRRQASAAPPEYDLGAQGPAALARPAEITEIEVPEAPGSRRGVKAVARRYVVECVIDQYNARGQIGDRGWRAGMVFRAVFYGAVRSPRVSADYGASNGARSSNRATTLEEALAAKTIAQTRYEQALQALPTAMRAVVISVAGQDEFAGSRLPQLKDALQILADHFKVPMDYSRPVDSNRRRA